jgi:hypothetical protein
LAPAGIASSEPSIANSTEQETIVRRENIPTG